MTAARADHDHDEAWYGIDEAWYDGDVRVQLQLGRGEGAVYAPGEPVRFAFATEVDAYHLVYAIDTDGFVRLLFPRWWEDDGWVPAGTEVELRAQDLAWPASRWGTSGIVYVEALASPVPFDFAALDLAVRGGRGYWSQDGRPFHVVGDPFLAFNDIHHRLFPGWDEAVFAVDYSYFYVNEVSAAPRYLGFAYERVYLPPPAPRYSTGLRFGWSFEFGSGYCRPVYRRYYVPGVHVVYHPVYHHHHVVYSEPAVAVPAVQRSAERRTWSPSRERLRRETELQQPRVRRTAETEQLRKRREVETQQPQVWRASEAPQARERREQKTLARTSGEPPDSVRRALQRGEQPSLRPLKPGQKATKKQTSVQAKPRD